MSMKKQMLVFRRFAFVGQLGFSVAVPILLCLYLCWLLTSRQIVGEWVYLPGIFLGLGSSAAGLWKLYQTVMREEQEEGERKKKAFNRHR